jgi:hypothetical protein
MHAVHEDPSIARLELLGHLAAAARLAMQESPHCDGVVFTVEANPEGFTVDCSHTVKGQPVSGWGQ